MKKQKDAIVTDRFSLEIYQDQRVFECKVDELFENNETYYHLDILSPIVTEMNDHVRQSVHHIEMRIDCNTNNFKIRVFNQKIPIELLKIEQKLSDAICKRHE